MLSIDVKSFQKARDNIRSVMVNKESRSRVTDQKSGPGRGVSGFHKPIHPFMHGGRPTHLHPQAHLLEAGLLLLVQVALVRLQNKMAIS
jgi:hypothetical protein